MDDLQWADAETLELLHYLSHNWRKGKSPILLLILMQSEALRFGETPELDERSDTRHETRILFLYLVTAIAVLQSTLRD